MNDDPRPHRDPIPKIQHKLLHCLRRQGERFQGREVENHEILKDYVEEESFQESNDRPTGEIDVQ